MRSDGTSLAWGPDCETGLSVGLTVRHRVSDVASPLEWRWAVRNLSDTARSMTIYHDLDRSDRVRLQVLRPGAQEVLEEFVADAGDRLTTSNVGETVHLRPGEVKSLQRSEAMIGARVGEGVFRLRVILGGPDFTFTCFSGEVEIEIR